MELIFTILIFGMIFLPITFLIDDMSNDMCTKQPKKKKCNVQDEMSLFNDAEWVKKVILSCKSNKQIWNAYKLSENLRNKYRNKVNNDTLWLVSNEISKIFDDHHDKLITNETRRFNLPCN